MVGMGFTTGHSPIKRVLNAIRSGLEAFRSRIGRNRPQPPR
jgi:hypothetical protein